MSGIMALAPGEDEVADKQQVLNHQDADDCLVYGVHRGVLSIYLGSGTDLTHGG